MTTINAKLSKLEQDQARILRCLYEWCYVGRESADPGHAIQDIQRLHAVPAYVIEGELSESVQDSQGALRLLLGKGLIEQTRLSLGLLGLLGGHIGWKLLNGKHIRVLYRRERADDNETETATVRVKINGKVEASATGPVGSTSPAYYLTVLGIQEAEKNLPKPSSRMAPSQGETDRPTSDAYERAYLAAEYAFHQEPNLIGATDKETWNWLLKNVSDYKDKLPDSFDTFARYLRQARQARGEQKNSPRAGRRSRSVVSPDQL